MASFTVAECMTEGCSAELPGEAGTYYCDACIAKQQAAYGDEVEAFDAYHRFADACAQAISQKGNR